MISLRDLADRIRSVGFSCTSCGACCRRCPEDDGLVLVTPKEVRAIAAATGLSRDAIVRPYPEMIEGEDGARYTLGWCLRQDGDACRFLAEGKCTVYAARPWICRTYPFMLEGDDLLVASCDGIGKTMTDKEAKKIAEDLLKRRSAEENEAVRVQEVLRTAPPPAGCTSVIDSEGVTVIHG
jgi:Fe-S-cluster containining protein